MIRDLTLLIAALPLIACGPEDDTGATADHDTGADTDCGRHCEEPTLWKQVSAGDVQTCAVTAEGNISCWGGSEYDRLPHTSDTGAWIDFGDDYEPVFGEWTEVAVPAGGRGPGTWHTCAMATDYWHVPGCWGRHDHLQTEPEIVDHGLALTRASSCGLEDDGEIACWGEPMNAPSGDTFVDLAGGLSAVCGIRTDGPVVCFDPAGLYAERVGSWLAVGVWDHACAVVLGAPIACWNVATGEDWTPDGGLPIGTDYTDVCVGGEDGGCVLDATGRASCWGPYLTDAPDAAFTQLSCGNTHACGITDAGAMTCWGECAHGQCDVPR